jgi:hypothetical protein
MDDLRMPFIMTVTGPKWAGKTTFITGLVKDYIMKRLDFVIVFCPTCQLNDDYGFIKEQYKVPYTIIVKKFDDNMEELIKGLEELYSENINEDDDEFMRREKKEILMILDDCGTDPILERHSSLAKYCIKHRHISLSVIVVGHSFRGDVGVPKSIRSQMDYAVFFKPASIKELHSILEDSLFKDELKVARDKCREIFSEKYKYIVYIPSNTYQKTILINFEEPLL